MASRAVVRAASVAPTPAVMQFRSKPVEKKGSRVLKRSVKKVVRPLPTAHRPRASPPLAHHLRHTAQVKKVGKKVAKKAAKPLPKGARPVQGGAKTGQGPLGTAKSFFSFGSDGGADSAASQDNWLYQARVHTAQPTAHMHCSCFATEDPRRQPGGSPLLLGHGQSSLAYSTCPRPSVSVALACLPCRSPAL